MDQIDIRRAAKLLIEDYDDGAELAATRRADKAVQQGDLETEALWRRVLSVVQQLQRQKHMP